MIVITVTMCSFFLHSIANFCPGFPTNAAVFHYRHSTSNENFVPHAGLKKLHKLLRAEHCSHWHRNRETQGTRLPFTHASPKIFVFKWYLQIPVNSSSPSKIPLNLGHKPAPQITARTRTYRDYVMSEFDVCQ